MDQGALSAALEKIRGSVSERESILADGEADALSCYLSETVSRGDLSAAEQLLCSHIRSTLQARATQGRTAGPGGASLRTNHALRDSLERFMQREFGAVTEDDLRLLRDTKSRLDEMAQAEPPSDNQVRLVKIIAEGLASHDAWRSAQAGS